MLHARRFLIFLCFSAIFLFATGGAFATFPEKPVTLIVPFAPGGSTDIIGRGLAEPFREIVGQPLIILNRPGGAGAVALTETLTFPPDGYTLVLSPSAHAVSYHLGQVKFDYKVFDQICNVSWEPLCFVVKKNASWNNMKDLITQAGGGKEKIKVGVGGSGSLSHLTALGIQKASGVQFIIVFFAGNAPAKTALLGGHISIAVLHPSEFLSLYQAGDVKILCAATDQRSELLPEVPTLKEQGIQFAWDDNRWISAPKGLPKDVLEKLRVTFKKAMESPSFKSLTQGIKIEVKYMTGEQMDQFLKSLFEKVGEVTKEMKK